MLSPSSGLCIAVPLLGNRLMHELFINDLYPPLYCLNENRLMQKAITIRGHGDIKQYWSPKTHCIAQHSYNK
jgi:hypothetical protein